MSELAVNSQITWPSKLKAQKDSMAYNSIDLLYKESPPDAFGDQLGFILSCTRKTLARQPDQNRCMLHKLDVVTLPDFARSQMSVTHEVLPNLQPCSQIITVNEELKIAAFDSGCVVPIKNFGLKKTFNVDVMGRLAHHRGQVTCLAANAQGTRLASGCTAGQVTLYQVDREQVQFLTKSLNSRTSLISAMTFVKPGRGASEGYDETALMYATDCGQVTVIDTRAMFGIPPEANLCVVTKPRMSVTSILVPRTGPEQQIFLGGPSGELMQYDFRDSNSCVRSIKPENGSEGVIRRMKEVVIYEGTRRRTFIAYSDSSREIKILDIETMKPDDHWKCDRLPEYSVRDLIQVDDRIVTCGDNCSIGCWYYERETGGL